VGDGVLELEAGERGRGRVSPALMWGRLANCPHVAPLQFDGCGQALLEAKLAVGLEGELGHRGAPENKSQGAERGQRQRDRRQDARRDDVRQDPRAGQPQAVK
jgi:hypothetical protein